MPDIIHLLPESIANQIAAGEVVQRPASVVKELIENAIDAAATQIRVIIRDAGKSLVQVVDDGCGMSVTDARMCFERHATSKIKTSEDLFRIKTMGFRGEALASISAVAQVQMKTKIQGDELGTRICIEGSKITDSEPAAILHGTSVEVKNLFYNVPARRNFLKSNSVEMRHIIEEFQRAALSHPQIAYNLYQNDMEVYNLPAGKLVKRIVNLFGKNYQSQLVTLQEKTPHFNIKGYIGKPEYAKKTRGEQFIFVNERFIKNNYLNHAVQVGYENLMPKEYYPFFVLFIEIDPNHIDVNVHPTKTEIKFIDERTVYGIIKSAVRQALGQHNITPSLDYDMDINLDLTTKFGGDSAWKTKQDLDYERFRKDTPSQSNIKNWEALFEKETAERPANFKDHFIIESGIHKDEDLNHDQMAVPKSGLDPQTFQIHGKYIISQVKSGMMIINQVYAHQRIVYEKYLNILVTDSRSTQKLLFPEALDLNPSDFTLLLDIKEEIIRLGFDFNIFGKNSIIINGIPAGITDINEKEVFEGLVEQFKLNKEKLEIGVFENLALSMARYAAIKEGRLLGEEARRSLIDQLFGCKNPNYSPFGGPTYVILGMEHLEGYFKDKN
jgi:DNA mismatch repair protein MutL